MARRTAIGDEWEDDPDDEFDGDSDNEWDDQAEDDDESETVPCPYCKRAIHEDAERCPYCDNYMSREDAPPRRKPWWIILGVSLCLFAIYRWIVG